MSAEPAREGQRDPRLIALVVFALIAAGVVAAILLARSGGEDGGGGESLLDSCRESPVGAPSHLDLDCPDVETPAEGTVAVVDTGKGEFTIELDTANSPLTTASFANLVEEELYTKTKFHRIVPGFVIQGGDPLGDGTGGPGYSVTETPPPNAKYTRGVVAMAKSGTEPPGTSGSQFFVVTGADVGLPPEYAILGTVSEGIDVVNAIGRLGTPTEKPKETILIDKIELEEPS
jgi:cyclophilin family peptidyl-prolyl cis-trans isomerase